MEFDYQGCSPSDPYCPGPLTSFVQEQEEYYGAGMGSSGPLGQQPNPANGGPGQRPFQQQQQPFQQQPFHPQPGGPDLNEQGVFSVEQAAALNYLADREATVGFSFICLLFFFLTTICFLHFARLLPSVVHRAYVGFSAAALFYGSLPEMFVRVSWALYNYVPKNVTTHFCIYVLAFSVLHAVLCAYIVDSRNSTLGWCLGMIASMLLYRIGVWFASLCSSEDNATDAPVNAKVVEWEVGSGYSVWLHLFVFLLVGAASAYVVAWQAKKYPIVYTAGLCFLYALLGAASLGELSVLTSTDVSLAMEANMLHGYSELDPLLNDAFYHVQQVTTATFKPTPFSANLPAYLILFIFFIGLLLYSLLRFALTQDQERVWRYQGFEPFLVMRAWKYPPGGLKVEVGETSGAGAGSDAAARAPEDRGVGDASAPASSGLVSAETSYLHPSTRASFGATLTDFIRAEEAKAGPGALVLQHTDHHDAEAAAPPPGMELAAQFETTTQKRTVKTRTMKNLPLGGASSSSVKPSNKNPVLYYGEGGDEDLQGADTADGAEWQRQEGEVGVEQDYALGLAPGHESGHESKSIARKPTLPPPLYEARDATVAYLPFTKKNIKQVRQLIRTTDARFSWKQMNYGAGVPRNLRQQQEIKYSVKAEKENLYKESMELDAERSLLKLEPAPVGDDVKYVQESRTTRQVQITEERVEDVGSGAEGKGIEIDDSQFMAVESGNDNDFAQFLKSGAGRQGAELLGLHAALPSGSGAEE
eukprot:g3249.t1